MLTKPLHMHFGLSMFQCHACGRQYASKATLNRHQKNHLDNYSQLTCAECNVTFRRGDLLTRHMQMHDSQDPQPRKRRRCHTACASCRFRRAKCDGLQPCGACSFSDIDCTYSKSQGRVSEQQPASTETEQEDLALQSPVENTEFGNHMNTASHHLPSPPSSNVHPASSGECGERVPALQDSGLAEDLFQMSNTGWQDTLNLAADSFWPFSTSWQWTHEDLYLQAANSDSLFIPDHEQPTSWNTPETYAAPSNPQKNPAGEDVAGLVSGVNSEQLSISDTRSNASGLGGASQNTISHTQGISDLVGGMVSLASAKDYRATWLEDTGWPHLSSQLGRRLGNIGNTVTEIHDADALGHFIDQYFHHFHSLWPLVTNGRDTHSEWHPLLYLTLTSIGALYCGQTAATHYGSSMHKRLRTALMHWNPSGNHKGKGALDIGRAMLLTQVAALYFEQEGAFSAAQQLGAALYAHAHRMRLFNLKDTGTSGTSLQLSGRTLDAAEAQRMLAFGILREEVFVSVLLNRRPMLSYEEMSLPLPLTGYASDQTVSQTQCYDAETDLPCRSMLFSDLVRIALDEHEALPALRPTDLELLLFGLQQDVWRFSHDDALFQRLINRPRPQMKADKLGVADLIVEASHPVDLLDHPTRKMHNTCQAYYQTVMALDKWKQAMKQSQMSHPVDRSRSPYLSAHILFELSFLRLLAPIEAIQQAAYQLNDSLPPDSVLLDQITRWTGTSEAAEAIKHAESIWLLMHTETSRIPEKQARYNILALIALHQAAAVVWSVMGTDKHTSHSFIGHRYTSTGSVDSYIFKSSNTQTVMLEFAKLYPKITSTWGVTSSFSKTVQKLADHPFPQQWLRGS